MKTKTLIKLSIHGLMSLTLLLCSWLLAYAQTTGPGWIYTGNLNIARAGHIATLLPNGKVLVAGGYSGQYLDSAELYDPATGTWSVTGSLNVPRAGLSATLLPNGKVLVVGGVNRVILSAETRAELYDPATGKWTLTGNLNNTHWGHSATLLANGKVLIAGGFYQVNTQTGQFGPSNYAELYDPDTGTWSNTANLNEARFAHTATLLQNGKVLVAGGDDLDGFFGNGVEGTVMTNELYDPNTGSWSITGSLNTGRGSHTATLLPNGSVLAAGGGGVSASYDPIVNTSAELYNPATGTWSYTASLSRRASHTATLLANGQVLVSGGGDYQSFLDSAEIYDPATGNWKGTANLNTRRVGHTTTLLPNGRVLVVGGGDNANNYLRSAELYDPGVALNPNPIDDPQFFVRQHYRDFLNREGDPDGLTFWSGEIFACGSDQQCIEAKRINDSGAFFLSIEFQQTGYLIYRMHKAAFGNLANAPVPITFADFLPDTQKIGKDVIVNQVGWEQALETNKLAFALEFVQRPRFLSAYTDYVAPAAFVDALFANAGVVPSEAERAAAINEFASAPTIADAAARARALRRVAEHPTLIQREFNNAFVLMQYFGYLRRDPNDAPEATLDFQGYNFWLNKLNSFNGNFVQAEMVKAFISSAEYRRRFGL